MKSLIAGPVAETLNRLHQEAAIVDGPLIESIMELGRTTGLSIEQLFSADFDQARAAHRDAFDVTADNFLNVSPDLGRFLYMCARAQRATRIVEFGTSMGVSTIYLASALRDMGEGQLIGTELEPSKVKRARANLEAARLADLCDIRQGNALDTLRDFGKPIDLLLLDGAAGLYLPVLKLLEPHLKTGSVIIADNAFDRSYLDYTRDPSNGYMSQQLPIDEGRGSEFSVALQ